jgi:hypothetical protein
VPFLPKGELFISKAFLNHFWQEWQNDYVIQLEHASRALGLDVVGIDLSNPAASSGLLERARDRLADLFTVCCFNGPAGRLIQRHGFYQAMLLLKRDKQPFSGVGMTLIAELKKVCPALHKSTFNAVAIADDIAGSRGLLFSHECFERAALPWYRECADVIHSHGLYAFFHSDGDTRMIARPLAEAGFDCLHIFDVQAGMDLYEEREQLAMMTCFMGHIDVMAWDSRRVEQEVRAAAAEFTDGGLILGSSCGISMEAVNGSLSALYPEWRCEGVPP